MRLRDDLEKLAHGAPPPPEPDVLLRRARSIRHRRAVIVPAAAVVAVLVLTITYLSRVDGESPIMTLAFRLDQPSEPGSAVELPALDPELERVRDILRERASFLGLKHPDARVEGDRILLDFGGGEGVDLERLAAPGNFQVRKVLATADVVHDGTPPTGVPSAEPGTEASTLDELIAKLTPVVYSRALNLRAVGDAKLLPGFEKLTPREVALLPPSIQLYVPTISCAQITRATRATPVPSEQTVVCMADFLKMQLDRAALGGFDLADATTGREPVTGMYDVRLRLKEASVRKWTTISAEAANGVACEPVGSENHCMLAFMVDGEVLTTPVIQRPLKADEARMSFQTLEEAKLVAATLGPRELPPGVKASG